MKRLVVPVVMGALGTLPRQLTENLGIFNITVSIEFIQKSSILGSAKILRRILETNSNSCMPIQFQYCLVSVPPCSVFLISFIFICYLWKFYPLLVKRNMCVDLVFLCMQWYIQMWWQMVYQGDVRVSNQLKPNINVYIKVYLLP